MHSPHWYQRTYGRVPKTRIFLVKELFWICGVLFADGARAIVDQPDINALWVIEMAAGQFSDLDLIFKVHHADSAFLLFADCHDWGLLEFHPWEVVDF